jgi:anti-anti-sigma factor
VPVSDVRQRSTESLTIALRGEVDVQSAEAIRGAASLTLDHAFAGLRLDLAEVTFMDSQGLNALIGAHRTLERDGATLRLANVPAPLQRLLELTGLDRVFDFEGSAPRHGDPLLPGS